MYERGKGVAQSDEKAVKWYRKAADQGNGDAQSNLGVMYREGRGVDQSDEKAVEWYNKAVEQGHAGAQNNLGVMYERGKSVAQSDEKAVKWYRKAADQGNGDAQSNLGVMYREGRGVDQSDEKAVEWWKLAAEQGEANAQFNLGWMYNDGIGVEQSYEEAFELYRLAADQGHFSAMHNLAVLYYYGRGVDQSYEKAVQLCGEAVNGFQKNVTCISRFSLGRFYQRGLGVRRDYKRAFALYKESLGCPGGWSEFYIGMMYEEGIWVDQDIQGASEYYSRAKESGFTKGQMELWKVFEEKNLTDLEFEYKFVDKKDPAVMEKGISYLKKQYESSNDYSDYGLLNLYGVLSGGDVIEMKEYGMYRGGEGRDRFVLYEDYAGKEEGYKLMIGDLDYEGEEDFIDFSYTKISGEKDLVLKESRFIQDEKAVAILNKNSGNLLVVIMNKEVDEVDTSNFIFAEVQDVYDEM